MKRIYVGNLPFSASEEKIRRVFSEHGNVHSVKLVTDEVTGRIRGFGFVEMDEDTADTAIKALDGAPFEYRTLRVHEAAERHRNQQVMPRHRASANPSRPRPDHRKSTLTFPSHRVSGNRRVGESALRRP